MTTKPDSDQDRIHDSNQSLSYAQYGQIEKKYHDLYENIPCMLRSVTLDGIIFACNELYLQKLGYKKDEVIGKSVFEHTAKQSLLELQEEIVNWKQTQKISNREIWMQKKDGTVFPVVLNGTNLYDESYNLVGRTGVLVDLSDTYNARQIIEQEQDVIQKQFEQLRKAHKTLKETEHKYRSLYEDSPDLLRTINIDGIILDCNNSYCKKLGYAKDEVIGKSVYDFVAPTKVDAFRDSFETWQTTGKVSNKIAWFKRKNGTIFPGLISAKNLFDEAGKLVGSNTNIRDATEIYNIRKNLEENEKKLQIQNDKLTVAYDHLLDVEQRYRTLYEQSPDLVRTIDMNETVTDCNERYCNATGYTRDEIVGKSLFEHLAKRSYDDMKKALDEFHRTGHINNREIWIRRKDGTEFPTLLLSTNLYDKDGKLCGRLGNLRDMSEIYSTKKELEEQKIKRLSAIGELSARIAHDLRNPLSILLNTIAIIKIKNPEFEKNNKERFERIDRAIKRMSHQIDEVMDYVTPKPLDPTNSSLLEIIKTALSNVPTTGIEIQIPENDMSMSCDYEKLEIVLTNLILNAIQAMKDSGKIFIRLHEVKEGLNNFAVIEVEDTGPGIPDDVLPKVFDPLFTTKERGTGLGLVSCKSIIENHGGTISIKTHVGHGTTFIMRIPIQKTIN
ncbi:MAG: PAS domain S-box protein [Nitrosotalea sp.]